MALIDKINSDLKEALKSKDAIKVSTLRLLISAIKYSQIDAKKEEINDKDVLSAIKKQVKQRKDSIESYEKGGREDLKQKEEAELAVLKAYLPDELSDEKLAELVKEVIRETGASTKKEMGKVIKTVIEKAGGAADGKKVSQLVGNLLGEG